MKGFPTCCKQTCSTKLSVVLEYVLMLRNLALQRLRSTSQLHESFNPSREEYLHYQMSLLGSQTLPSPFY